MKSDSIKEAKRAEKAMNQALRNAKSSKQKKKQRAIPMISVVAEKV